MIRGAQSYKVEKLDLSEGRCGGLMVQSRKKTVRASSPPFFYLFVYRVLMYSISKNPQ